MSDTSTFTNTDAYGQFLNSDPTQAQQTASGYINAYLSSLGLSGLTSFAQNLIINQGITDSNILQQELYATPQFQQAFPEIAARQQAGLTPLAPADIVNLRQGYQQVMAQAGIPQDYLSSEDMQQLVTGDVSPSELNTRITDTLTKIQNDPTIAPQLNQLYGSGMTPGQLAAWALDPEKSENYVANQVTSAQLAARAQTAGFGQLTATQASGLTGMGINADQAATGFSQLAQQSQLMTSLPGQNETNISADQQIAAQFGQNASDQQLITQRAKQRVAAFSGGGSFTNPGTGGQPGGSGVAQ